jgi:hypothetical protein
MDEKGHNDQEPEEDDKSAASDEIDSCIGSARGNGSAEVIRSMTLALLTKGST